MTTPNLEIAPSILAADFSRLGEQVRAALEAGARIIHVDVMDGRFVPNISMGPQVVKALRPLADEFGARVETHLMIVEPERYLHDFAKAGSDMLIVHVETCPHLSRTVQQIRELGVLPAVTLNPATPLVLLQEILPEVEQVLVMTVNPGFGGQELIPSTLDKITRLHNMLAQRGLAHIAIEVDGGIHAGTIADVARAGATIAVAGSAVFNPQASVEANMRALTDAIGR
ncbi:MAG: ribulose-phosphate 3-epimerase [Chloroflexales bacterium]|nr:ribulose-phosphate 3-epimerase [Chloroflexales bacterium]